MGRTRSKLASALLWAAMAALFSQNLVFPAHVTAVGFEDEKNFFPNPITGSPPSPTGSYSSPSHSTPTPSGSGTPSDHCGNPSSGGHHNPTPSHDPSSGYHSPPSSTPAIGSTPSTSLTPPYPCIYWRNHPTMIWGMMGWGGSVANSFGMSGTMPGGFGGQMSLIKALSNTRTDGYGELYREGTAALLNSMADHTKFPYTTQHVRDSFVAALSSNKAAAAQAQLFKLANEGRIKPRA